MEAQEVYKIAKGINAVTIVHRKGLDEQKPILVNITGNIDSVSKWIEKRYSKENLSTSTSMINPESSHVIVNRENILIDLIFNETDQLNWGYVSGMLKPHPDFQKWRINSGSEWDNKNLSEFIKMNRSCFVSKSDAMKLSAELANLRVRVDKEVEKSNDNRANTKQLLVQNVIDMNIPKTFKLKTPVFKGTDEVEFEVEIYVNANNYMVSLVSPEANDTVFLISNSVIDLEKNKITELCPGLVIIEK